MAKAGRYNIVIEEGSTFTLDLVYKNSDGVQQDLSGNYTARMQIRDSHGGDLIDSSDSSPGNITIGSVAQNGTYTSGSGNLGNATAPAPIRVGIPANITKTYDFDSAVYDLELASGGTTVERVIEGTVKLSREVTQ